MNYFYRYLTTYKTSLLALAIFSIFKEQCKQNNMHAFSGLAVSEFHLFRNMFPIHYKLWKTITFTKEY